MLCASVFSVADKSPRPRHFLDFSPYLRHQKADTADSTTTPDNNIYNCTNNQNSMAINLAERDSIPHCLFLGDLSAFCTEEILFDNFSGFGKILLLQVAKSKSNKKPLLFGFLGYEEESSAYEAMREMNGVMVCGRAIK